MLRSRILQLLRSHPESYVSGELISEQLLVSRTAVWKQVQALRAQGYVIESHSRRGYCLRQVPDLLFPEEVVAALHTSWLGQEIHYFDRIDSTNTEAKRLAVLGKPEGTIVIAEEQETGRGRLARNWFSPHAAGIWLSIILRPAFLPREAPKCTLLAAVAVNRAVKACSGVGTGIKWPNDIVYQGRKIAGILTEMSSEMDAINHVIIGIGVNVNIEQCDFPIDVSKIATSLSILTGASLARVKLLIDILFQLERLYEEACAHGFARIFAEWRSMSITIGSLVEVTSGEERFSGYAIDIDDSGALLVDTADGRRRVTVGDVKVRAQAVAEL